MSFSVIHFSDIHFTGENDTLTNKVEKLKTACVSSLPSNGVVVIVISGDIAFSGKKQQYDLAREMLESVTQYITEQKRSKVYVVCSPGTREDFFGSNYALGIIEGILHRAFADTGFLRYSFTGSAFAFQVTTFVT